MRDMVAKATTKISIKSVFISFLLSFFIAFKLSNPRFKN
ncbi:MAG: DUF1240 domain-containing protein [Lachnospiraceae bacterium]|nr:DUF1240 domain-containing protein [Lachnospiraceae bacterium]